MRHYRALLALVAVAVCLVGLPAQAYIGPGAGITMLGALWGVVAAIGVALASLVLWPLRVLFRGRTASRKARKAAEADKTSGSPS